MQRITQAFLDAKLKRINIMLGLPIAPYTKVVDGPSLTNEAIILYHYQPNPHNLHFDQAYGGIGLHQMCATGSGIHSIKPGYGTKREMDNFLEGMIRGIEAEKRGTNA